jgi:hypothetical protein
MVCYYYKIQQISIWSGSIFLLCSILILTWDDMTSTSWKISLQMLERLKVETTTRSGNVMTWKNKSEFAGRLKYALEPPCSNRINSPQLCDPKTIQNHPKPNCLRKLPGFEKRRTLWNDIQRFEDLISRRLSWWYPATLWFFHLSWNPMTPIKKKSNPIIEAFRHLQVRILYKLGHSQPCGLRCPLNLPNAS